MIAVGTPYWITAVVMAVVAMALSGCVAQDEPNDQADGTKTNVVDLVAFNDATGKVGLVIVEDRTWDGSEERLLQLQEKVNTYLAFALDGQMEEAYPQYGGKPVQIILATKHSPDSTTAEFLRVLESELGKHEVEFVIENV